jgi:hypothetical protein
LLILMDTLVQNMPFPRSVTTLAATQLPSGDARWERKRVRRGGHSKGVARIGSGDGAAVRACFWGSGSGGVIHPLCMRRG